MKIEKIASTLGLSLALLLTANADSWTDPSTGETWKYMVKDGGAVIGEGTWHLIAVFPTGKRPLVIPSFVNGYPTVAINDFAFESFEHAPSEFTSITIPETVRSIGAWAFSGLNNLKTITIPNSVTNIGFKAFKCSPALKTVEMSSNIEIIGGLAFAGDEETLEGNSIASLRLPKSLRVIGKDAFKMCSKLTKVYVDTGETYRISVLLAGSGFDVSKVTFIEITGGDVKLDASYGPFDPGVKMSPLTIPALIGYAAKGLPSGLKFDKKTGTISGVPKQPTGDAGVTVTFTKKNFPPLTTNFVVADWPKVTVACPELQSRSFMVGVLGDTTPIPVMIEPLSSVKSVKAAKLPSGMKLVQDKKTKEWSITGSPTKAGTYNVVLTVTTVWGEKVTTTIPITVQALSPWAVGTFVGIARQVDHDALGIVIRDGEGLHDWYDVEVTVTVSSNGKISGKIVVPDGGGTFSFKISAYTSCEDGIYCVSGAKVSSRSLKMSLDLKVSDRMIDGALLAGDMKVEARQIEPQTRNRLISFTTDNERPLRQCIWNMKNIRLPPSVNKKSVSIERDGYVYSIAFGKKGAATDAFALITNPKKPLKKGKPIFSVVDYAKGVWYCELFGSVICPVL